MLALVKAFLKAGHPQLRTAWRNTSTGTPQGGIVSLIQGITAFSGWQ